MRSRPIASDSAHGAEPDTDHRWIQAHAWLDLSHRLMPASTAWRSISASSSSANSRVSSAPRVSSSCLTLDAPTSGGGHARVAQHPRHRHLRQRLAAALGHLVERAHVREPVLGEHVLAQEHALGGARVRRHAVEVAVGEHALGERREGDAADALLAEHVEQVLLDPAVEQRVRRLVDQQRGAELAQDPDRLARALARVGGDPGVQRLALAHRGVERAERLLQRRVRVEPVRVEDVDVVEPHPRQALVERGEQVLARAPLAVRPGPHVVAGLGRDHELVAVGAEVLAHVAAEVGLGGAGGGP